MIRLKLMGQYDNICALYKRFDMKRILILCLCFLVTAVVGIRIYYVNSDVEIIPLETYSINEWVSLDGCFQDVSDENTSGYSVRVLDFSWIPYAEFVSKYGESEDYLSSYRPKMILDVTFEFKNENNTTGRIELFQYTVEGDFFTLSPNSDLWKLTVPQGEGAMGFVLEPNTSYEFHVPYIFFQNHQIELSGKDCQIIVSRAPIKKVIKFTIKN